MSRATGKVIKDKKIIGYFIYNGTVDRVCPNIYETSREAWDKWDIEQHRQCSCTELDDVILYADYGNGFYFKAKACLKCGVIHRDYTAPFDIEIIPSWSGFGCMECEPTKPIIIVEDGEPEYIEGEN